MISEKMEQAFNDQINKEFYSEYLYLAMKAYFAELNLQGFVNWFDVQVQEEHAHGMGMYNYVFSWVDVPDKEPQTGHQQVRVHYRGGSFDTGAEVPEGYWDWSWAGDVFNGVTSHYEYRYSLMFYNYDENCFNYLKARDNKENELALFGLAPASFTFTNVQDGVGVCGSYMVSATDWFTIDD